MDTVIIAEQLGNQGSLGNQIAFLTAVATLVTGVVTFAMVIEMRRQRRSMYRPDFVALKSDINAFWNSDLEAVLVQGSFIMVNEDSGLRISIVNVGLGAAKQVEVYWKYDVEQFVKRIKVLDDQLAQTISFPAKNILKIERSETNKSFHDLSGQNREHLSFIDHLGGEQNRRDLYIPHAFVKLLSLLINGISTKSKVSFEDFKKIEKLPQIQLALSYLDIGGDELTQKFDLSFDISQMSFGIPKESYNFPFMQGHIQAKIVR